MEPVAERREGRYSEGGNSLGRSPSDSMPSAEIRPPETLNQLVFLLHERGAREALRFKRDGSWHSISGEEVYRRVARLALSLRGLGIRAGDRVALLSENRPEWAIADLAMACCGAVDVPLYPTLTGASCEFILKDCGARAIFVSADEHLRTTCQIWAKLPELQFAIDMEDAGTLSAAGLGQVLSRVQLCPDTPLSIDEQQCFEEMARAAGPEDLASIVYTSGTTGMPKGVMLTHRNLVSNMTAVPEDVVGPNDLMLSFLPLSHVYERMVDYVGFYRGAPIAYAESIEQVPENLLEVRPTIAAAVPRFFEKLYARVLQTLHHQSWVRRKLFWWAIEAGRQELRCRIEGRPMPAGLRLRYRLAERLVFAKLRARLGGRIHCFASGGAPLSAELSEFFNAAGITVCEGYGLTETSPIIACTVPARIRPGTVGLPLEGVEVRIAEDGEILVRGPNVMRGYYNRPEETAQVMVNGWLHTGDIGEMTPTGELRITDRKKELLKTAGGKFVAPQPVENLLRASGWLLSAVVIGDRRPYAVALLVPNPERLEEFARERGIRCSSYAELLEHPEVLALVNGLVGEVNTRLAPFEQIKRFALLEEDFSVEAGTLTATLKVRRKMVDERYRGVIEGLYARELNGIERLGDW